MENKRIIIEYKHEYQNGEVGQGEILDIKPMQEAVEGEVAFVLIHAAMDFVKDCVEKHDKNCSCPALAFYKEFLKGIEKSHAVATKVVGN
ncbi:MAG: hypothetical protein [Podoviridae sp. ctviO18]|nr:MAG: hypothetical protein [Podoviridae sp. ctviO18]